MKNKFIFTIVLFTVFIGFLSLKLISEKPKQYKVLDIIRADLFYVDINNNSKPDKDELFKLKDVYAFSDELNNFALENCKKLNIDKSIYLKSGYIAQNWAIDNLKNKNITITSLTKDKTKNYSYITADFKGYDLGRFYLENGLAFAKDGLYSDYAIYQNLKQAKLNANEISKLNFVLLNPNSNIYHKLNCELSNLMHKAKLVLYKNVLNYTSCKICYNNASSVIQNIPFKNKVSFYKNFNNFELYLTNPLEFKKPENKCSTKVCKRLLKEINDAKSSIDIAIYGCGNIDEFINALKNAKARGVNVRLVVDYSRKMDEIYPYSAKLIKDFNAHSDKSENIMHNKFFIFDKSKIITGSANVSSSGFGGYSANSIIVINSKILAERFKKEFEEMYNGRFSDLKTKFDTASDNNISVYFSPKDDLKSAVLSKINQANKEICVSAFYLTQKSIIDALISAKQRGVKVYIIQDALGAYNFKDRVSLLRKSNIALIVENWGGKNHEKTMIIDNKFLIMGSANFSNAAYFKNDENMLIIENEAAAKFYRDYFFYLFNSIDKKYLKLIPRAESLDSINSCYDGIDNNFDGKIDSDDEGCAINK